MPRALPLLLLLLLPGALPAQARRVLFVGNSLTYVNDLPGLVARISATLGAPLETHALAHPDYGIEDHLAEGVLARLLARERWDVVVLQQGPSSLPESGANLTEFAAKAAALARANGACPAVYMVWAEASRPGSFDAVRDHYRAAADSAHAQFLPAGEAWRAAWRRDPSLPFYAPDGLHPTPLGTYLAALTISAALTGRSPTADTTTVAGAELTPARRRLLAHAAANVLSDLPRQCAPNANASTHADP